VTVPRPGTSRDTPGLRRDSSEARASSGAWGGGLPLLLPDDAVERIAQRAAELVEERFALRLQRGEDFAPYFSVKRAAEYMDCSPQRIYDLLTARRLRRFKDGRRTLVAREEIDAYLARNGRRSVAPALPRSSRSSMDTGLAG
jgi:excisionase family DNA binding protein